MKTSNIFIFHIHYSKGDLKLLYLVLKIVSGKYCLSFIKCWWNQFLNLFIHLLSLSIEPISAQTLSCSASRLELVTLLFPDVCCECQGCQRGWGAGSLWRGMWGGLWSLRCLKEQMKTSETALPVLLEWRTTFTRYHF